jgi:hypothetical protein
VLTHQKPSSAKAVEAHLGLIRKIDNPEVLQRCLDLLTELADRIRQDDCDAKPDADILRILYVGVRDDDGEIFSRNSYPHAYCHKTLYDSYQPLWKASDGENAYQHEFRDEFLRDITEEVARLERYKQERASSESKRMKLEMLRRSVPDPPRLDQLLRNRTALERTYDRCQTQLERLQRVRLGQPVAPRIDVNISSS